MAVDRSDGDVAQPPTAKIQGPSEQFLRRGRSCNQEPFSWLILVAAVTCLLASILCIAYSVYCTT